MAYTINLTHKSVFGTRFASNRDNDNQRRTSDTCLKFPKTGTFR